MVLSVASPVFQAEFFGPAKEKSEVILVQDTTKEAFKMMMDHIYLKDVNLDVSFPTMYQVVNLAEKYQMRSLMQKVVEHLTKLPLNSEEVVMEITSLAEMFPSFDEVSGSLLHCCASFLMENVFQDIRDISSFTAKYCEDGRSSEALKLLSLLKDVSPRKLKLCKENEKIEKKAKQSTNQTNQTSHPQQGVPPPLRHHQAVNQARPARAGQQFYRVLVFILLCLLALVSIFCFSLIFFVWNFNVYNR
eukprot:GFUD01020307.1.p1 GENE.GFUD01020307.1~~GFUD01020307.1.p1  ORF type:complete len:289 (-),score=86.45 GFUD01020307.1:25-765(-)